MQPRGACWGLFFGGVQDPGMHDVLCSYTGLWRPLLLCSSLKHWLQHARWQSGMGGTWKPP